MDWNSIVITALSTGFIFTAIQAIRFWKQNKTLKENEVKVSDVETQKAQMDLVSKYRDEMLSMVELVKEANEKNFTKQDEIIKKLDRLDERVEILEKKIGNMEGFLDGPYHRHLAQLEGGALTM